MVSSNTAKPLANGVSPDRPTLPLSISITLAPFLFALKAAKTPAIPPPITKISVSFSKEVSNNFETSLGDLFLIRPAAIAAPITPTPKAPLINARLLTYIFFHLVFEFKQSIF